MKYSIVNKDLFTDMVKENLISAIESIWKKALADANGISKFEYLGGFRPEFKLEKKFVDVNGDSWGILTSPEKVPGVKENSKRFSGYAYALCVYICNGKEDKTVCYILCNKKDFVPKKAKPICDVLFADKYGQLVSRRLATACSPVAYHNRTVFVDPVIEIMPGFTVEMPLSHFIKSYSRDKKRNKMKWDDSAKKILRSI